MLKIFLKLCIIFFSIVLAFEFIILIIGISFNIMNPGIKGVSSADFEDWIIITLPTVVLLLLVVILKKLISK